MQLLASWAGGDAEVVVEALAELVVDAECLGGVAFSGERGHEQLVAGLAVGLESDQLAAGADGGGEFGAADAESGVCVGLECAEVEAGEPAVLFVDPGCVFAGQERPSGDEHRDLRGAPGAVKVVLGEGRFGAMHGVGGGFDVDLGCAREGDPVILERDEAPELREQGGEAAVLPVWPERLDELVAGQRSVAVGDEEGEEQPSLSSGKAFFEALPVELKDELAAELHFRRCQSGANITPSVDS